jgi:hypothetical protein
MQIITEKRNFYNKHLKLWKRMPNFAENALISFIKLMFKEIGERISLLYQIG